MSKTVKRPASGQGVSDADDAAAPFGELRLRDATVDDASEIADIYNQSILASDATMDDSPKSAEEIVEQIRGFDVREVILVMCDEERMLGWGIIKKYSDREGYRFSGETAVYLRRELVSRGLGTRLKKALIERCLELGYHHLVAKIFADNRRSIEYNLKLGYEMVGRQREIGFKNGRWKDVVILQLILDDSPRPPLPDANLEGEPDG